ncbi:hypothetical protein HK100_008968 [Physocladia obscura]|uniref:Uncharacterized protein n=1 Tax=Physocladia obscura TaxID=109957 RepID=A0AAD5T4R0_9FUNG|nr:hypothetical protein HK100_008968 [Physocladia obscura]
MTEEKVAKQEVQAVEDEVQVASESVEFVDDSVRTAQNNLDKQKEKNVDWVKREKSPGLIAVLKDAGVALEKAKKFSSPPSNSILPPGLSHGACLACALTCPNSTALSLVKAFIAVNDKLIVPGAAVSTHLPQYGKSHPTKFPTAPTYGNMLNWPSSVNPVGLMIPFSPLLHAKVLRSV